MFSVVKSAGIYGMDAFIVDVETDSAPGLPHFDIVGLPDTAVKESGNRVRSAIKNLGYSYPANHITVNLAPGDRKKAGPLYDLPILLSLLNSSGRLRADTSKSVFIGELSLSGEVRPASGIIAMVIKARQCGYKSVYVPATNAAEASVVEGISVYAVKNVQQLISHLRGETIMNPVSPDDFDLADEPDYLDFCDVMGQYQAKRALEIAASGGHNVLLIGPPGSGKSMLAKRLPSILPDMTFEESIETTKLHSIAGILPPGVPLITHRPYRSPHHTVSPVALVGGGTVPGPGEISLSHNGVLFLDELPEFPRQSMEILRQPLEDRRVVISRVAGTFSYPCSIMLVAAMNPCPCGYFGHPTRPCVCSKGAVSKYLNRVSGPLLDRIDIHIEVPPVAFDELDSRSKAEPSAKIRERVNRAREIQRERYKSLGIKASCNAALSPSEVKEVCRLSDESRGFLKEAFDRMGLSARAYDRVLKVSRTVADLDGSENITPEHLLEATRYRSLDRKYWSE